MSNIKNIFDTNLFDYFNSQRVLDTEMPVVKGIPHMFMTTPMLNLTKDNCMSNSFLAYMYKFHNSWLSKLSFDNILDNLKEKYMGTPYELAFSQAFEKAYTYSPFIKILSNSATNFTTKDAISRTVEIGETYYGYKELLPSSEVDGIVGDEFTIEFLDWQGLPVLHILNAWFVYHNAVRRGTLVPSPYSILYQELDYTSSLYYFITDMDGETIQYWAKYTGVVPISVPFSQFSSNYNDHDVIKYPVNFLYSFKEDMNPEILTDFNKVVNGDLRSLYDYYTNVDVHNGYMYSSEKDNLPMFYLDNKKDLHKFSSYETSKRKTPIVAQTAYVDNSNQRMQTPTFKLLYTTEDEQNNPMMSVKPISGDGKGTNIKSNIK